MAALPLQLGIFLLVWRKMPYYIVHESVLFAAAVSIGLLVCAESAGAIVEGFERWFAPVAVVALSIYLVKASPMLGEVRVTFRHGPRNGSGACRGRQMLGPHARVGGRWWSWYASGAEHWYDVERDLVAGSSASIPPRISPMWMRLRCALGRPSAFPGWYADAHSSCNGFYFAQTDPTLRCVELSSHSAARWLDTPHGGQLYRFQQEDDAATKRSRWSAGRAERIGTSPGPACSRSAWT